MALGACGPSKQELASLAGRGAIQQDAPIKATSTIIIEAPRERVWRVLVNVSRWPRWQPDISKVTGVSTLASGATFTWQTGGTTIHSRVVLFSPPSEVSWTGHAETARAIHVFVLTPLSPTRTKVESRESMDGFLISWFYNSAALQKSEDTLLRNLAISAKRTPR
ncbi:MAG: SRPBCC domain-containing protein [Proteobacteria bacterium]|nr:SRPBCC domain-containing protein [Pseudomonadota bacterium]